MWPQRSQRWWDVSHRMVAPQLSHGGRPPFAGTAQELAAERVEVVAESALILEPYDAPPSPLPRRAGVGQATRLTGSLVGPARRFVTESHWVIYVLTAGQTG
jgi:hypothetical protein